MLYELEFFSINSPILQICGKVRQRKRRLQKKTGEGHFTRTYSDKTRETGFTLKKDRFISYYGEILYCERDEA